MGRTGNARVVVADRLFTLAGQFLGGQVQPRLHERPQVVLDADLVLRGRRNDPGIDDGAVRVELIGVIQDPPR